MCEVLKQMDVTMEYYHELYTLISFYKKVFKLNELVNHYIVSEGLGINPVQEYHKVLILRTMLKRLIYGYQSECKYF